MTSNCDEGNLNHIHLSMYDVITQSDTEEPDIQYEKCHLAKRPYTNMAYSDL